MNPNDSVVVEGMIGLSVTVAWVLSVHRRCHVRECGRWDVMSLRIDSQVPNASPIISRKYLICPRTGVCWRQVIHLQRRNLRQVPQCLLVLLTVLGSCD